MRTLAKHFQTYIKKKAYHWVSREEIIQVSQNIGKCFLQVSGNCLSGRNVLDQDFLLFELVKTNSLQHKVIEPQFRDIVLVVLKMGINRNDSSIVAKEYIGGSLGHYWVRTYPKNSPPALLEAAELLGIALACYDVKGVLKWQRK